jgi:hypothetical protein
MTFSGLGILRSLSIRSPLGIVQRRNLFSSRSYCYLLGHDRDIETKKGILIIMIIIVGINTCHLARLEGKKAILSRH